MRKKKKEKHCGDYGTFRERLNSLLNLVDKEFALRKRAGFFLFLKEQHRLFGGEVEVFCRKARLVDTMIVFYHLDVL